MNDDRLEIVLQAALDSSINKMNDLSNATTIFKKKLETTISTVNKFNASGSKIGAVQTIKSKDGSYEAVNKFKADKDGNLRQVSGIIRETKDDSIKLKDVLNTAFNINKLYLFWNLTKRLRDSIRNMMKNSVDFIETQNKFDVSMGTARLNATRFVNRLSESIGIAKTELMNYQSIYKNILGGLGDFTDDQAEKISESLTKMALDYSSLYNVNRSDAMNKFQSALVGSIRPIRSDSGYDVSDTTIGAKASSLGIERSVGQLNQMEKRLLRIIVLMDQLRNTGAMNDLARTIEQPANQIKVLQDQVKELGIWIGNVFMGTIGRVLPYINAFVMVLKELAKTLAYFVGFTTGSTGLGEAFEVAEESAGGIAGGVGKAAKSAKELRNTLMDFDVLHVIQTPTENTPSGGSGGGGSVGIDPKILNALKDYESTMERVRMKASEIRDKIMDWLGFTKAINPFTGEIMWEYQGIGKTLQNFIKWFSELSLKGKLLVGLGIGAAALKLVSILKALKATALGKWISSIVAAGINWVKNLGTLILTAGKTSTGLTTVKTALLGNIKVLGTFAIEIAGVILAIKGFLGLFTSVRENLENGNQSLEKVQKSTAELTIGLAALGAVVGGPIGAVVGVLTALGIAVATVKGQTSAYYQEIAEKNVFGQLKVSTEDWLNIIKETSNLGFENTAEKISAALDGLNNDFIESSSEVEGYGIRFGLMGQKITNEDMPKITDSVSRMCKSTESMIDENTSAQLKLWSDMYKQLGNVTEEEQSEMLNKIIDYSSKQKTELAEAQNNITTTYDNAIKERGYLSQEEYNFIQDQLQKIRELTQQNMSLSKSDLEFYINDTSKITKDSYADFEKALTQYQDEENKLISDNYNFQLNSLEALHRSKEISDEKYNEELKRLNKTRNEQQEKLDTELQEFRTKMYDKLITKYNEVKNNTDENSKAMKKVLEETFKDSGIDIDNLSEKFGNFAKKWENTKFSKKNLAFNVSGLDSVGSGKIGARASGGPVSVGEMFVAREAGPELVGKIGNTTTVMNNDQIVQAVSQGVAQAVASVMGNVGGGEYKFYLDGNELAAAVEKRQARLNNIYGTI